MLSFNLVDRERSLELDREFKKLFNSKLDFLLDKAPSDSSISSQFSKIKKGYEGAIEIISSRRRFLASAFHKDPQELVLELVEDIHSQILKWRNDRILLMR